GDDTGERPAATETQLSNAAGTIGIAADARLAMSLMVAVQSASNEKNTDSAFPFEVTEEVLRHGRDRYMIYCVVCHDAAGTGLGTVVQRGYSPPPSYHIDRLRNVPVGHLFKVVSLGYGSMPSYRKQINAPDRWAIVAYIRALQLSQHFPAQEVTEE